MTDIAIRHKRLDSMLLGRIKSEVQLTYFRGKHDSSTPHFLMTRENFSDLTYQDLLATYENNYGIYCTYEENPGANISSRANSKNILAPKVYTTSTDANTCREDNYANSDYKYNYEEVIKELCNRGLDIIQIDAHRISTEKTRSDAFTRMGANSFSVILTATRLTGVRNSKTRYYVCLILGNSNTITTPTFTTKAFDKKAQAVKLKKKILDYMFDSSNYKIIQTRDRPRPRTTSGNTPNEVYSKRYAVAITDDEDNILASTNNKLLLSIAECQYVITKSMNFLTKRI